MLPGRPSLGRGSALLKMLQESRAGAAAGSEASGSQAPDSPFKTVTAALAKIQVAPEPQPVDDQPTPEPVVQAVSAEATPEAQAQPAPTETAAEAEAQPDEDDLRQATIVKKGSAGSSIKLAANFIEVRQAEGRCFAEYSVRMDPPVDEIKLRSKLINSLTETIGRAKMFTGSRLILPKQLPEDKTVISKDGTTVTLEFTRKRAIKNTSGVKICNYVVGKVFNALNLVPMKSGTDKYFYNPKEKKVLAKHKLEVWPGYVFTVDEFENGVYLQIDPSSKVIRSQTVHAVLMDLAKKNPSGFQKDAVTELVGRSLITSYNNRTYRLDEISFESSPSDAFDLANGTSTTFVKYYKDRYNLDIKDGKQPMLIHWLKRPDLPEPVKIVLIPEFCFITGMSDAMKSDFRIMKDVAEHTRLTPKTRGEVITRLLTTIRECQDAVELLDRWGIELDSDLVKLDGRKLMAETLYFGGGYREVVGPKGDWGRAATTKKVLVAKPIQNWAFVFPANFEQDAKKFCMILQDQAPRLGIQVARPTVVPLQSDRTEIYLKALKELPESTELVVTLFGGAQRSDRYGAIKKYCYVERPIASQVLLQKTISNEKRMSSVAQKVALQLNCKLGGELWSLKLPLAGVMVVGIDIYRDKAAGRSAKMIAGVVCTMNEANTKFHSRVVFEEQGKDFKQGIVDAIVAGVGKHREVNGRIPKHLVVFRDGVNAGQLEMAHNEGIRLHEVIRASPGLEAVTVTYAIVQKRHNVKLFWRPDPAIYDNPAAGTVLDHSVCRRAWYDFYIVPMSVSLGTVTPTHFTVLYDSAPIPVDEFQRIAYAMTFMYFNWPGNVKVPAQCQYAHKLVELVGEHLHLPPDASLEKVLFYL